MHSTITLRHTSVYSLSVTVSAPGMALDTMLGFINGDGPQVDVGGSYINGDRAVLAFRIPTNDSTAIFVAERLVALLPDVTHAELHTGNGVNRRLVAQQ